MNFKKEIWLLLIAFILPIILGTVFFYINPTYFTKNTVNYGKLIIPIITTNVSDIKFNNNNNIQGIWSLIYNTENCNINCKQAIKDMKTIHVLLNDNMKRLQKIVTNQSIAIEDNGFLFATISEKLKQKLADFPTNSIFLMDPIGNIVLFYNARNINIKKVIKDISRLFKYSRIG